MLRKKREKTFLSIKSKLVFAYTSIVVLTLTIFSLVVIWRSETVVVDLAQ